VQSGHYLGGSHGKGLAEQVTQLLEVAAAPAHKRRGRSPQVVVFFPSGVDEEVSAALTSLGAKVANGPGSLAPLCGVVGNNVTNLDVTTLCALVSEVTWRDPHCEALQAWASRTIHWKVGPQRGQGPTHSFSAWLLSMCALPCMLAGVSAGVMDRRVFQLVQYHGWTGWEPKTQNCASPTPTRCLHSHHALC
jgi:hypothetical protein